MSKIKKFILGTLLAALLVTACGAASSAPQTARDADANTSFGYNGPAAPPAPMDASKAGGEASGVADGLLANTGQQQTARMVIKNATLALVVKDPLAAVNEITQLANSLEGFVVSSSTSQASTDAEGNKIMRANMTIRVPSAKLDETLAKLKAMAVTVNNENISGQDVTSEYTDLESQLRNLESAEVQLQKIMDGATKTEDVLSVYNQLVSIRGQIELVKGQMKYYRESAAMSAITLDLIPDALSRPIEIGGWRPDGEAKEALEALVRTLQNWIDAAIWLAIYVLPLALIVGLPAYALWRWGWRKLHR